jgi:ATP-dependent Clp protease ATP-binding subunit ClpC
MFERYTEKARRVIFFARYEASQFGSPYIESEHLLLGLLREDKGLGKRLLRSHGSIESIRKEIEAHTPARKKISTSVDMPLSEECKRVLAYAAEEADRLSRKDLGTEHLLLGLLREEKSFAAKMLRDRGLRLSTLREEFGRAQSEEEPGERAGVQGEKAPARWLKETSLASIASRDLTQAARDKQLDPLVGREDKLESVIRALCRRTRNNPLLVGEPGVGKKAIVHGLAQRIADRDVPARLENKRILALDVSAIAAFAREAFWFGGRAVAFLEELSEEANLIVFLEDLFAKAGGRSSLNITKLLRPLITQGEIQCIATAAPGEYQKGLDEETWLGACFNVVEVRPPDEAEALKILAGIKQSYEKFHNVLYSEEALQYAVYHSQRYIPGRFLPEKAIDLLDEAGAAVAVRAGPLPAEVSDAQKRLKFVVHRMMNAVANHEFEKARYYSEEERKERENLRQMREKYNLEATSTVTLDDIENVVARWTGISIARIQQERSGGGHESPQHREHGKQ